MSEKGAVRVIVDGYNGIFSCDQFERMVEREDLQSARLALCSCVARLGFGEGAVVVFDGDSEVSLSSRTRIASVDVVFSPSGSSADEEIEAMVERHKHPASVHVATSDGPLAAKVRALGAKTIGIKEFLAPGLESGTEDSNEPDEPRVKFEGPGPAELKYWMRVFKCEDEE
jgi:predicted RNA-binding protein with PIN domain